MKSPTADDRGSHREPFLVLVGGAPATGKTSIARQLGRALATVVLSKDAVKDALFASLGWYDRAWSRELGIASMQALFNIAEGELSDGRSVILETTLDPRFDTEPVHQLLERTQADVTQVFCTATPDVVVARALARAGTGERHPGHVDQADADELRAGLNEGRWKPLPIRGRTIHVDTTAFAAVSIDGIAADILSDADRSYGPDRRS